MQTIELEGTKAITKFDLDRAPTTAFVEYRGELYHIEQSGGLLWELADGPLPEGADLTVIAADGSMVVKPAAPSVGCAQTLVSAAPDPARQPQTPTNGDTRSASEAAGPQSIQESIPREAPHDASPDHA